MAGLVAGPTLFFLITELFAENAALDIAAWKVLGLAAWMVRDLDPLERELVEQSHIQHLTTDDLANRSDRVRAQIERLARLTDVIYVHIDMDVLDPREVPGHPLTVANGPTSLELGAALTEMFKHPKVAALGIASTPANERNPDGLSLAASYNLIKGALDGVQQRSGS